MKALFLPLCTVVFIAGCANFNEMPRRSDSPDPKVPTASETQISVVENPNYIPKAAEEDSGPPALESTASSVPDVEILVYEDSNANEPSVGQNLPDFATGSELSQRCEGLIASNLPEITAKLVTRISSRLNVDSGAVYVAPTVIPPNLRECVMDLSPVVKSTLKAQGSRLVPLSEGTKEELEISQNTGNSALIPQLIRACRQHSIPYLVVTTLRGVGTEPALTVRAVRVVDGVTMAQALERVGPKRDEGNSPAKGPSQFQWKLQRDEQ